MKTIKFLLLLTLCMTFQINNAKATGIVYCGEFENYKCKRVYNNLGDLWDNTSFNGFYNLNGFQTEATYFKLSTAHFDFYVPYYVVEREFSAEDIDGYFSMTQWMNYDKNKNFIYDDIEKVIDEFEKIYNWYAEDYDIEMPWKGGGEENRMDVILADITESAYGLYSFKENEGEPYIKIDLAKANSPDGLKGTIAHEMFHAIQNGNIEAKYLLQNNFMEGTATMLQSKLYGGGEHHLDFDDISTKQNPNKSIFGLANASDTTSYGSYLWYSFIHQNYGKTIVNELLESYASLANSNIDNSMEYLSFLAVDKALKNHDSNIVDAYAKFALWNYDKGKYTDGKKMRPVSITKVHDSYIENYNMGSASPYAFGSNYIEVNLTGNLQVNFTGNQNAEFHLSFLPLGQDSSVDNKNIIQKKISFAANENIILPFKGNYKKFIMIVSVINASIDDTQGGDAFNQNIYPYIYSVQVATDEEMNQYNQVEESNDETPSIFTDVDLSHKNYKAILYLKDKGIINGYSDGTFRPDNDINRAELLKIIIEGQQIDVKLEDYRDCFLDVKIEWFAPYVCYAKSVEWIEGYADGTFKPAQTVNKVEALKMLLNAYGYASKDSDIDNPNIYSDIKPTDWFAAFVLKAKQLGILEEISSTFEPHNGMTRGSISENLYRLLTL